MRQQSIAKDYKKEEGRFFFSMFLWRTKKELMSPNYQETDSTIYNKPLYTKELSRNEKSCHVKRVRPSFLEAFWLRADYPVLRRWPSCIELNYAVLSLFPMWG